MRSTKRPVAASSGIPAPDDRPWRVRFHRDVAKLVVRLGGEDSDVFRPTIGELRRALESNPKQFAKKKGLLSNARAARVTYADGIPWRAVFMLDEAARIVTVLALDRHDDAYERASRRL